MADNQFRCSGDCLRCHPNQRQYCASQFTYNSMRMIEDMQKNLMTMQGTIDEMKAKLEAIQGNEAMLFDPQKTESHPIAQSGDGAESRIPETI